MVARPTKDVDDTMIQDLLLRWVVTVLFALSAAESVYAMATGRRVWTHIVSHSLHFVMAVAMVVMAWPSGAALPTSGPMVFFLLATVWFVGVTLVQSGHRGINAYHAAMMLAMAWMYAVMGGGLLPTPAEARHPAGNRPRTMARRRAACLAWTCRTRRRPRAASESRRSSPG